MSQATKCLILLAVVAIFFITEIIPLAVTSTAAFIPVKQVFSGLSNSTVVLFAGMFVVGASMFYTGLAQKIGSTVVKITGTGENSLMFGIMVVGAALSAVLSNTGTAACLLPVVLGVCAAAKIPASRELMPLAFACGLPSLRILRIRQDRYSPDHCRHALYDVHRQTPDPETRTRRGPGNRTGNRSGRTFHREDGRLRRYPAGRRPGYGPEH